ncbi:MAG: hypothetical protein ACT4O2_13665 [Beijerinckiaceae bacterium]
MAGLLLSPGGIAVILLIPIVVKLMCVVQTRFIIAAGFFMMRCAFASSSKRAVDIVFTTLVIMRTAQTAALAFLFVPMRTIAFATLLGELNGAATALYAVERSELTLTALGRAASAVHDIAVGQAYEALRTQAAVLACWDVFLLAGVVAFAVIAFCFVLSGTKGSGGAMH